jgi:hypothetical protein
MCVRCNRVASFARPNPNPPSTPAYSTSPDGSRVVPGAGFHGGDVPSQETPLATSWPISQLQGTKGEKGTTNLPGDVRMNESKARGFDLAVLSFARSRWPGRRRPLPPRRGRTRGFPPIR